MHDSIRKDKPEDRRRTNKLSNEERKSDANRCDEGAGMLLSRKHEDREDKLHSEDHF